MANTLHVQRRGPGLSPLSGSYIPHTATEPSHAATQDPACGNKDRGFRGLQLRPGTAK